MNRDGREPPTSSSSAGSSSSSGSGAPRTQAQILERMKELDFEHRARQRSVARVTLSLGFLRSAWRRWWTPTAPASAASVPRPAAGTLALTFVGHATVMITSAEARVLTDPMLESSLHGLRRARAAAIHAADLADVSLALVSHAHGDHLSPRTLRRLPRSATVIVPPRCGSLVKDLGLGRVIELGNGQTFTSGTSGELQITAVPARHSIGRGWLGGRGLGASGYVVRTGGRTIYFAGDTGYFPGFVEIGRRFDPDVALLPIGGYDPAPFRREHLSPLDALYAFQDLGARLLIPIAHGSFELGYEPIAEPLGWMRALAREHHLGDAFTALEHGQTCLLR